MRVRFSVKIAGALACATAFTMFAHADELRVKTDNGKIEGVMAASSQVRAFLGIPYAAPPVGPLRWQPPQPAAKWKGVRQATSFGSHCMQPTIYKDMVFHDPGQSEDCLTLNVWTPAKDKDAKLPVMVWIYGGGYNTGGTSEARQNGEYLAQKGVVVVSMNYRLGIFGFFELPALAEESPHHAAGNYGLMDQTAALEWVKRNIAQFGGDPANVTIFGESAGSFSVSSQMASPLAQGLFVHAIGESGGAFPGPHGGAPELALGEQQDMEFAQKALGTTDLAQLRSMSADAVLKAASEQIDGKTPHFFPDVDGYFLPQSVPAIYAAGKQAHIPLLAGWNRDEGTGAVLAEPQLPTVASMKTFAEMEFGAQAPEFLSVYAADNNAQAVRAMEDYAGARFIAYSTWAWLEAQVKTGDAPVYRYHFDLGSPGDKNHPVSAGAFHSDDIEYVFGTLDSRPGAVWRPEDRKLSAEIQDYWTNFAKTGDPNGSGLAKWPVYDKADGWQVMHLAPTLEAKPDTHRARYLFLQKVWGK